MRKNLIVPFMLFLLLVTNCFAIEHPLSSHYGGEIVDLTFRGDTIIAISNVEYAEYYAYSLINKFDSDLNFICEDTIGLIIGGSPEVKFKGVADTFLFGWEYSGAGDVFISSPSWSCSYGNITSNETPTAFVVDSSGIYFCGYRGSHSFIYHTPKCRCDIIWEHDRPDSRPERYFDIISDEYFIYSVGYKENPGAITESTLVSCFDKFDGDLNWEISTQQGQLTTACLNGAGIIVAGFELDGNAFVSKISIGGDITWTLNLGSGIPKDITINSYGDIFIVGQSANQKKFWRVSSFGSLILSSNLGYGCLNKIELSPDGIFYAVGYNGFDEFDQIPVINRLESHSLGIPEPSDSAETILECYPNPFNSICNFTMEKNIGVEIYDINGCLIEVLKPNQSWRPENLPTGQYYARPQGSSKIIKKLSYIK